MSQKQITITECDKDIFDKRCEETVQSIKDFGKGSKIIKTFFVNPVPMSNYTVVYYTCILEYLK
jgi:hypothetical protein